MDGDRNNGADGVGLANRVWRAERRLDDLERKLEKLEVRAEKLEQRPLFDWMTKSVVYVLVMLLVALVTGTSVNLSGLLK